MNRAALLALCALALPHLAAAGPPHGKPLDTCLVEQKALLAQRGVLGFLFSAVSPGEPAPPEVLYVIRSAPAGFPAHAAGLRPGDLLLVLGGKSIARIARPELEATLASVKAGQKVELRVLREGKEQTFRMTAAKPSAESVEAWVGQHIRDQHSAEDYRRYLRQLRAAAAASPR